MRTWQKALGLSMSAMMLTGMMASAAQTDPGTGTTDIRAMNVDPSAAATVVVDYIGTNGQEALNRQVQVAPLGSTDFRANDATGLPDGWQGSAILSSDKDLAAVATSTFVSGTYPINIASYPGFTDGANSVFFALVQQRDTVFTRLSIQNTGSDQASIQMTYYNRNDGSVAAGPISDTLPAGAQKTYDLSKPGTGNVPSLPRNNEAGDGWNGSVKVTADKPVAGVAMTFLPTTGATAYPGATTPASTLYFPIEKRRFIAGDWAEWCANVVQNTSSTAASITLHYVDRVHGDVYQTTTALPPFSSKGFNTRFASNGIPDHNAFDAAVGNDSNGSIFVTSNQPIIGESDCQVSLPSQNSIGIYSSLAVGAGTTNSYAAQVFRTADGSGTVTRRTGVIVFNLDANATTVTVSFRDPSGTQVLSFTDSIPAKSSHGYNTGVGSNAPGSGTTGLPALGNAFQGQVVVTSDGKPISGVAFHVLQGEADSYNMYGK